MRLIDADALIARWKAAMLHMTTVVDGKHPISIETLIEDVEKFPAIAPESLRPQGRWIRGELKNGERRHKCSVCRDECRVPTVVGKPIYDYCPNCGAKMKGAENDGNQDYYRSESL